MDTASPCISVSSLRAALGNAGAPLLLDVRRESALLTGAKSLPGAVWCAPETLLQQAAALPSAHPIVTYCVQGHDLSQEAAKQLRQAGHEARYLEGGIEAWKAGGAPTVVRLPELGAPGASGSRWITRARPKIDRIACPWLVRRFIDPLAVFFYVPAGEVLPISESMGAVPYDIPGVRFSHRGERCSFDAILEDAQLHDPALDALARIVRGADTVRPELSPQSPGLLAVSLGLSVNYPDDHAMLAQGMVLYDALYAWLRSAQNEAHNADLFEKS
jgi:rhodanese-related sulfurtransferase